MNDYVLMDAITDLDTDLLEKHFAQKGKIKAKRDKCKRKNMLKWSAAVAACLILIILAIPTVRNFIGYQSGLSEDELFARTNTYFDTYEELASVIGTDTLLKNMDFSALTNYELRLRHELDDVEEYHTVSFGYIMPEDWFGVGIYFPPYTEKTENLVDDGNKTTINGITVQYKNWAEGTNYEYYYVAEFEYGGCCYQVRSAGHSDEIIFWNNLNELLGN